jgi:hypothetical protein
MKSIKVYLIYLYFIQFYYLSRIIIKLNKIYNKVYLDKYSIEYIYI